MYDLEQNNLKSMRFSVCLELLLWALCFSVVGPDPHPHKKKSGSGSATNKNHDPDPHPDPYQSYKLDPDPHQFAEYM
jgi:hypothetical protein